MRPRNSSVRIVLTVCLFILSVVSIHLPERGASQAGVLGYCAGGPNGSMVYVSQIFNTGLDPNLSYDSSPMQSEYTEYLKGRFDFKSTDVLPVTCPLFANMSQAQLSKRTYETQMRQAKDQIVELDWNYRAEPGALPGRAGHVANAGITAQADHTFCISDSYHDIVYFTGPVASPPPVAMYQWANGFTQFLKTKYSFNGRVYCNMGTAQSARRLVTAHLDGSKAAGKRVVETDWKYDASQVANTSPARPTAQDEDREPAQRPTAQPPNLQARDFAVTEHPRSLAYCVGDRPMAAAYDCQCLVRLVSQYRLSHVSDTLSASPTPLEELFKGERFDCKSCIQVDWKFKPGIKSVARFQRAREGEADCVVNRMHSFVESQPYPSRVKELLQQAMAACR